MGYHRIFMDITGLPLMVPLWQVVTVETVPLRNNFSIDMVISNGDVRLPKGTLLRNWMISSHWCTEIPGNTEEIVQRKGQLFKGIKKANSKGIHRKLFEGEVGYSQCSYPVVRRERSTERTWGIHIPEKDSLFKGEP